ncbi:MAG TPA: DUF6036 family nucleotidyltransferase [Bryobacteraceae bacterium]|nr:DUF6036 family nucleotidyltransferase [Bryobacteraceae bacterium]
MTRSQLEHLIGAAGAIADSRDIVVVGSQAILGQFPDAPDELLVSEEADVFPRNEPVRGELIDGSIGEDSPFHRTFGYYAHGVEEGTAVLPAGWRDRLVLVDNVNTRSVRGWCLEVHDLAIAKYAAGREKDIAFTRALARHGLADRAVLSERLAATPLDDAAKSRISARIQRDFARPE